MPQTLIGEASPQRSGAEAEPRGGRYPGPLLPSGAARPRAASSRSDGPSRCPEVGGRLRNRAPARAAWSRRHGRGSREGTGRRLLLQPAAARSRRPPAPAAARARVCRGRRSVQLAARAALTPSPPPPPSSAAEQPPPGGAGAAGRRAARAQPGRPRRRWPPRGPVHRPAQGGRQSPRAAAPAALPPPLTQRRCARPSAHRWRSRPGPEATECELAARGGAGGERRAQSACRPIGALTSARSRARAASRARAGLEATAPQSVPAAALRLGRCWRGKAAGVLPFVFYPTCRSRPLVAGEWPWWAAEPAPALPRPCGCIVGSVRLSHSPTARLRASA